MFNESSFMKLHKSTSFWEPHHFACVVNSVGSSTSCVNLKRGTLSSDNDGQHSTLIRAHTVKTRVYEEFSMRQFFFLFVFTLGIEFQSRWEISATYVI